MHISFVVLTQSKSKTPKTRSVHSKFNCITVKYNGTQNGIYIILEMHKKLSSEDYSFV